MGIFFFFSLFLVFRAGHAGGRRRRLHRARARAIDTRKESEPSPALSSLPVHALNPSPFPRPRCAASTVGVWVETNPFWVGGRFPGRRPLSRSAAASRSSAERARCAAPGRSSLESYSTPSGPKRALGGCARQTGSDEAGKRGGPRPVSHSGSGADAVSVLCLRSH